MKSSLSNDIEWPIAGKSDHLHISKRTAWANYLNIFEHKPITFCSPCPFFERQFKANTIFTGCCKVPALLQKKRRKTVPLLLWNWKHCSNLQEKNVHNKKKDTCFFLLFFVMFLICVDITAEANHSPEHWHLLTLWLNAESIPAWQNYMSFYHK